MTSSSSSVLKKLNNSMEASMDEESGWTAYLELEDDDGDDHYQQRRELMMDCSYSHSYCIDDDDRSPSLVSDAASYAAWKIISQKNINLGGSSSFHASEFPRRLNFNKQPTAATRNKRINSCDEELEDTASSPVNSPKVGSLRQKMDTNNPLGRADDSNRNYVGREYGRGAHNQTPTASAGEKRTNNLVYYKSNNNDDDDDDNNNKCTELRKRGLCLVPLSMLLNR